MKYSKKIIADKLLANGFYRDKINSNKLIKNGIVVELNGHEIELFMGQGDEPYCFEEHDGYVLGQFKNAGKNKRLFTTWHMVVCEIASAARNVR